MNFFSKLERIIKFIKRNTLASDLIKSRPNDDLKIILFKNNAFPEKHNKLLFLDRTMMDSLYEESEFRVGSFNPSRGTDIALNISNRLSQWLAKRASANAEESTALSMAWLFVVWTEIATILPSRHLARFIYKKFGHTPILIPIDHPKVTCLRHWAHNELEPLILAVELKRRGAKVFLTSHSPDFGETFLNNGAKLQFVADPNWWSSRVTSIDQRKRFRKVFCSTGIRDSAKVLGLIGEAAILGNTTNPSTGDDLYLWREDDNPTEISIQFERATDHQDYVIYTNKGTVPKLTDCFLRFLAPLSRTAWQNACEAVATSEIKEAHVCDHIFFESALINNAVTLSGGTVNIWPHSSNACQVRYQNTDMISRVMVVTESAKRAWSAAVSPQLVDVNSELMLEYPCRSSRYEVGKSVNVIFFAGAHQLNRMPTLDCKAHEKALRSYFLALSQLPECFQLHIKPKNYWEDAGWLAKFLPPNHSFLFTSETARELNLSNMVFTSVSMGSSALLEGIGRGIPALIARDFALQDYTSLDAEHMQVGNVDFVVGQIKQCINQDHYEMLVNLNLGWYMEETHFSKFNS
ncbi:hypothetical protein KHC17_24060 (plasmid) [Agrobacterium salinitolerans]|uniref:hypothetical protein n=1 Tax=Agrobacterium salinitolerans TaxID=1183413 RepID=UPI001C224189|nr:hypothetical protein [Agrobacterium salinitolerans]QXC52257.1 hypothetical protein KHC17_24060 [Agrobacterium salinitolerans]